MVPGTDSIAGSRDCTTIDRALEHDGDRLAYDLACLVRYGSTPNLLHVVERDRGRRGRRLARGRARHDVGIDASRGAGEPRGGEAAALGQAGPVHPVAGAADHLIGRTAATSLTNRRGRRRPPPSASLFVALPAEMIATRLPSAETAMSTASTMPASAGPWFHISPSGPTVVTAV